MTAFEEMGIMPEVAKAVEELDWLLPTDIKSEAIPLILSGRVVSKVAETGSGKTGAFGSPILQTIYDTHSDKKKSSLSSDDFRLSPTDRGQNLSLSSDGLSAKSINDRQWQGCRATHGLKKDPSSRSNRFYFTSNSLARIDFCMILMFIFQITAKSVSASPLLEPIMGSTWNVRIDQDTYSMNKKIQLIDDPNIGQLTYGLHFQSVSEDPMDLNGMVGDNWNLTISNYTLKPNGIYSICLNDDVESWNLEMCYNTRFPSNPSCHRPDPRTVIVKNPCSSKDGTANITLFTEEGKAVRNAQIFCNKQSIFRRLKDLIAYAVVYESDGNTTRIMASGENIIPCSGAEDSKTDSRAPDKWFNIWLFFFVLVFFACMAFQKAKSYSHQGWADLAAIKEGLGGLPNFLGGEWG